MFDLRPITSRLRARAFGRQRLEDVAVEQVELSPAAEVAARPAIALPGEWDRIKAFHLDSEATWEAEVLSGGRRKHPATMSYRIKDAIVANGSVYAGHTHETVASKRRCPVILGKPERIAQAQLCTNGTIQHYFGHWLVDGLLLEMLAGERQLPALGVPRQPWLHEPGYRAATGLELSAPAVVQVDDLWTVDDRSINAGRHYRMKALRDRLRHKMGNGPRKVFLDRGCTGKKRELTNRDALVEVLAREGFVEVFPERETPDRLRQLLSDAEICVGVEGSALTHATQLMPPDGLLLTLQPPRRFVAVLKVLAESADLRYAYVVGEETAGGFDIDPNRVLRTLDLAGAG